MRAVDTNVLVRLFTEDDPKQAERAKRFMRAGAWVSHIALVETLWVLQSVYGRTKQDLRRAVELLLSNESVTLQEPEAVAAALNLFTENKGVGFSDCLTLSLALKAGHTPLGTFDTKLAKIDGAALV
ncbi:MAG: PIN domain-containing protein [Pyrinomonadaceae bacterium]